MWQGNHSLRSFLLVVTLVRFEQSFSLANSAFVKNFLSGAQVHNTNIRYTNLFFFPNLNHPLFIHSFSVTISNWLYIYIYIHRSHTCGCTAGLCNKSNILTVMWNYMKIKLFPAQPNGSNWLQVQLLNCIICSWAAFKIASARCKRELIIILIFIYLFIFLFCLFALSLVGHYKGQSSRAGRFISFLHAVCQFWPQSQPLLSKTTSFPFSYLLFPSGQRNFKIQPIVWLQRHLITILVAFRYYYYYNISPASFPLHHLVRRIVERPENLPPPSLALVFFSLFPILLILESNLYPSIRLALSML